MMMTLMEMMPWIMKGMKIIWKMIIMIVARLDMSEEHRLSCFLGGLKQEV